MLKRYRVTLSETCSGRAFIQAASHEEAEEKAQQIIDDEGLEGFPDFVAKDGNAEVLDVELDGDDPS